MKHGCFFEEMRSRRVRDAPRFQLVRNTRAGADQRLDQPVVAAPRRDRGRRVTTVTVSVRIRPYLQKHRTRPGRTRRGRDDQRGPTERVHRVDQRFAERRIPNKRPHHLRAIESGGDVQHGFLVGRETFGTIRARAE